MKDAIEAAIAAYGIQEQTKDWDRDFHLCYQFGDFVLQDYMNNPDPTIKKDTELYDKLANCYFLGIAVLVQPEPVYKSSQTELLNQIVDYFKNKIASFDGQKYGNLTKYVQFSAHDDTLSVHLSFLKVINYTCLYNQVKESKNLGCTRTPQWLVTSYGSYSKLKTQHPIKKC